MERVDERKTTRLGRDRKPKHKLSRREGKDLFGTGGPSLERRLNQPPGMHGKKPTRRTSVYAEQLREKQRVKRMYGLRKDQFRYLVNMALQSREQTGMGLLKLLERRLDNVIYHLALARTRLQARQFVTHGHILVNGKEINIPSYLVKPGEEILMDESSLQIPDVQEVTETSPPVPGWLEKAKRQWWCPAGTEPRRDRPRYSGAADRRILLTLSKFSLHRGI